MPSPGYRKARFRRTEGGRSDGCIAVDRDPGVHQRHAAPLRQERPAEGACAHQRRLDRFAAGRESRAIIHAEAAMSGSSP
jgi:hypothetical protein